MSLDFTYLAAPEKERELCLSVTFKNMYFTINSTVFTSS